MRTRTALLTLLVVLTGLRPTISQTNPGLPPDSSRVSAGKKSELPEIQLKDYTIVGLAKVNLPQKVRSQIFQKVKIRWNPNPEVLEKKPPAFAFKFSRVKSSLIRLPSYPYFQGEVSYGSFQETGGRIFSQCSVRGFVPYLAASWGQSNGHLENAQWKKAMLDAGIHKQLGAVNRISAGIEMEHKAQGIWREWLSLFGPKDIETRTTLFRLFGKLEQNWNPTASSKIDAAFFNDSHRNANKYQDKAFDLSAEGNLTFGQSELIGRAGFQKSNITRTPGNLNFLTVPVRETSQQITSAGIFFGQHFAPLQVNAGAVLQKGITKNDGTTYSDKSSFYPQATLSVGKDGLVTFSLGYRPGMETFRLRNMVRELLFSDLLQASIFDYRSRIESSLRFNLPSRLLLNIGLQLSKIRNYTAPAWRGYLDNTTGPGEYPGWGFSLVGEIELNEISGKLDWRPLPLIKILAMGTARKSKIQKPAVGAPFVLGNHVPFIPVAEGLAEVTFKPFQLFKISLSGNYTGKRYEAFAMSPLDDYVTVDTRMSVRFHPHLQVFVVGRNLVDTKYEQFPGFQEPGRTLLGGFRAVF